MSGSSPSRHTSPPVVDADATAVLERWREAIEKYQGELRPHELNDILEFHGPRQLDAHLRHRLELSAQGKLKNIVSQISPFFDMLQQMLLLFTAVMPTKSIPLTLVAGGAYLTVKSCAQYETASKRIIDILDKIQQQLVLFEKHSKDLNPKEHCRRGLVQMFIAMIKFWVASVRFLSRNSQDESGNLVVADRWPTLQQKFLIAFQEIEDAVKFVQQLQEAEKHSWSGTVAKAQAEVVKQLPDVDLSEASFPCHEFPAMDEDFVGRSKEKKLIEKTLSKTSRSGQPVVVISGLGGVGKSALAKATAHSCKEAKDYDAILWLNAADADVLRESFTRIALRLLLRGASDKSDKDRNFMLVKNWLDKTARSWLLVYDNVDDYSLLEEYLPPDTGSVMITTRFQRVSYEIRGAPTRINLETLDPKDSLELFNKIRLSRHPNANTDGDESQAIALLESIDGLPLGIKQMASYIGSKRLSISKFQEQYNKMAKYILDQDSFTSAHTLGTLWSVQFQDIHNSSASKLLGLLSLCAPERVPTELFDLDEPLQGRSDMWASFCEDASEVMQAIDRLQDKALIDAEDGGDALYLHRLTQKAFLHNQYGLLEARDLQAAFDSLVMLLNLRFPSYGREKSLLDDWDTCSHYLPHVSAVAHLYKTFSNARLQSKRIKSNSDFAVLLSKATWYLHEIGEGQECLELLQVAEMACEDKKGLTYAYLCNTRSQAAMDMNDIPAGETYSKRAIAIREAILAPDDLDLALSYNNYANCLLNEKKYDESLKNYALADSIWEDKGNDDDVYRGLTYLNMGRAHSLSGEALTATGYFEKAETLFTGLSNDMYLIGVHYTWATLLMNEGDLLGAQAKYKRSYDLAIVSIPFQVVVSAIRYKLAVLDMQLGLPLKEAKEHFRQAMTIAEYHSREGESARIGRQWAIALKMDPLSSDADKHEAEEKAAKAKRSKDRLWKAIKRYVREPPKSEEEEYDWLVAAWYR